MDSCALGLSDAQRPKAKGDTTGGMIRRLPKHEPEQVRPLTDVVCDWKDWSWSKFARKEVDDRARFWLHSFIESSTDSVKTEHSSSITTTGVR
jgi:hypothetical protein